MKIAQIAPPIERVPPVKYGGTERVVSFITEGLVEAGHAVTLFASGDSVTKAALVATIPQHLREAYPAGKGKEWVSWTLSHLGQAYEQARDFDVIHDHTGHFGVAFAQNSPVPVVMTMHGPFTEQSISLYRRFRKPYLVTISHRQKELVPDLNHVGTIHHGVDFSQYPKSAENKGYLLFVGRISPLKGVDTAITIAERTGMPLVIAAKLDRNPDGEYFDTKIKPRLNDRIRWVGEVNEATRNRLYQHAAAMLHPLRWEEPFGLTLIEAMACGCPVIAFRKGSITELVRHERTGFVVDSEDAMVGAVQALAKIRRNDCVFHARTHFTLERMIQNYEALYASILHTERSVNQLLPQFKSQAMVFPGLH